MACNPIFASAEHQHHRPLSSFSPTQSLAVVETFINAFIACICFKRELIPWKSNCFKTRYLDDLYTDLEEHGDKAYATFTDTEPNPRMGKSQEFRILKRGEDERATRILDLIEIGVFPAVEGGFLDAVKFYITQGNTECSAADVLESYNLTFSYDRSSENRSHVRAVSLSSTPQTTTQFTSTNFRKAIQDLIRSLDGRSYLPRKRSLGITMLYSKACPQSYEAPGFLTETLPLAGKGVSGWKALVLQPLGKIGEFEVKPYRVILGASHVMPKEAITSSLVRDQSIGKTLRSLQKSSSYNRSGLFSTQDDPGSHRVRTTNIISSMKQTAPTLSQIDPLSPAKKSRGGNIAPQVMTSKTRKRNIIPQKLAELIEQAFAFETDREVSIFDLDDLTQHNKLTRPRDRLGGVMDCECRDDNNQGELLLCRLCGTCQHMDCYGWRGISQVRLPDEHFCYSCLLLPKERSLRDQMQHTVFKRLALVYLQEQHSATANELMSAMHLIENSKDNYQTFQTIVDELQHEGYVEKKGSEFLLATQRDTANMALREYINPLARISHHFIAIQDGETPDSRSKAIAVAVEESKSDRRCLPSQDNVQRDFSTRTSNSSRNSDHISNLVTVKSKRKARASPQTPATPPAKRTRPFTELNSNQPYESLRYRGASHDQGVPSEDDIDPTESPSPTPRTLSSGKRRASHCEHLVSLNRSSPSTVLDEDEVLAEAVGQAVSQMQWKSHGGRA